MKSQLLLSVILGLLVGTLLTLVFTIYDQRLSLSSYKNSLVSLKMNYLQLQTKYDVNLNNTKSLRQTTVLAASTDSKNVAIGNLINATASQITGDVSIYYKNLITGESVIIDADKQYYMASLYKVILTIYILDQIKNGTIQLTDTIGEPAITVEQALNKIITESNNEYAQSLANKFGWSNIETAMKQKLGIDFNFDKDLMINVKNIGLLFEDIALSLKITDTDSNYLLKLLSEQTRLSKLPKYLPKNIYSHNKTGEYENYSHDAGIFYTPKENYILIFLSKTDNPANTNEQMAIMSRDIYNTINSLTY